MRVGWMVLVLLLAGCTGPPEDPAMPVQAETQAETGEDGPRGTPAPSAPPTSDRDEVVPDMTNGTRYLIDQASLAYEDSFVRTTITAREPTRVSLVWEGEVLPVKTYGGCLAGAAQSPQGSIAMVFWTLPASLTVQARAAGTSVTQDLFPSDAQGSGVPVPFEGRMDVHLEPGERLTLDLGGDSPDLFSAEDPQGARSWSNATMDVTGHHTYDQTTGGGLSCGRGAREAEDSTLGASFYLADAEIGGRVDFTSKAASTMWILPEPDITDQNEYVVGFLEDGAQPLTAEFRRSAPSPGQMSLQFDRSFAAANGGVSWLFVDADWRLD